MVYSSLENYNRAITDYTRAIMLNPDFAFAYSNRGQAYQNIEQYDLAIADYREYERLTGQLESFMMEHIAEIEAALADDE